MKKQKTEKCANCGILVVFESGEGTPPEYEVCEDCGNHYCADCMDFSAPCNGRKCRECSAVAAAGIQENADKAHAGQFGGFKEATDEKAKHTPGPWKATAWGQTISIDAPEVMGIANINVRGDYNAGIPGLVDTNNARLICAAPELLAALEMVEEAFDWLLSDDCRKIEGYMAPAEYFSRLEKARAAIAKAKGE